MTKRGPYPEDVEQLRGLLEMFDSTDALLGQAADNDQRARFILSSNWLRDRGAVAAQKIAADMEDFRREQVEREQ